MVSGRWVSNGQGSLIGQYKALRIVWWKTMLHGRKRCLKWALIVMGHADAQEHATS